VLDEQAEDFGFDGSTLDGGVPHTAYAAYAAYAADIAVSAGAGPAGSPPC
jgi:hypothetical protein